MKEVNNIVVNLRKESYHFRALEKTHLELETSLAAWNKRKILSPEEEWQKKKIQKEKLAAKDTMEQMIRDASLSAKTRLKVG